LNRSGFDHFDHDELKKLRRFDGGFGKLSGTRDDEVDEEAAEDKAANLCLRVRGLGMFLAIAQALKSCGREKR
jgi:hypothetical protein